MVLLLIMQILLIYIFSVRVFFHGHWQLTGHQGKGGPSFIPLYHFHALTNIQTFICNFTHERLSHVCNLNACIYQTATWWDLPPYQITIWLIDNVILIFCLLTCWIDFRFCCSYLTWEIGGFELASTIILALQVNRLTKCASHPKYCNAYVQFDRI